MVSISLSFDSIKDSLEFYFLHPRRFVIYFRFPWKSVKRENQKVLMNILALDLSIIQLELKELSCNCIVGNHELLKI